MTVNDDFTQRVADRMEIQHRIYQFCQIRSRDTNDPVQLLRRELGVRS